jgi:phytoene synthase
LLARAEILGYRDRRTLQFAQHLGVGLALTELLQDVYPAARRGHYYIPEDELQHFGVDHADLRQHVTGDRLQALFRFQVERAGEQCRQALAVLPEQDGYAQRSNRVLAEINLRLLEEIAADGFQLLERRLSLTPLRKLWIAWRTVCRAKRYR